MGEGLWKEKEPLSASKLNANDALNIRDVRASGGTAEGGRIIVTRLGQSVSLRLSLPPRGRGTALLFANVQEAWAPGTNYVKLRPIGGAGDGSEDFYVAVNPPYNRPAVSFGAAVGDTISYFPSTGVGINGGDSKPVAGVVCPAIPLPNSTHQYEGIYNTSAVAGSPNFSNTWEEAH